MLPYGQAAEKGVLLWAVSELVSDAFIMLRNHLSLYHYFSVGWLNDIGETFERGTLACSINTEQRETFAFINCEACLLYSQNRWPEHGGIDLSE